MTGLDPELLPVATGGLETLAPAGEVNPAVETGDAATGMVEDVSGKPVELGDAAVRPLVLGIAFAAEVAGALLLP